MTFYWWSHWFWITLLANVLFPLCTVHTYPSQDVVPMQHKQNAKSDEKSITRLYQTTASQSWVTSAPTVLRAVEQSAGSKHEPALDNVEMSDSAAVKLQQRAAELVFEEPLIAEVDNDDALVDDAENEEELSDFEFKRSVESFNKTNLELAEQQLLKRKQQSFAEHKADSLKNYTNFSANIEAESTASSNDSPSIMDLSKSKAAPAPFSSSSSATVPSPPKIQSSNAAPDWISAMARITTANGGMPSLTSTSSSTAGDTAASAAAANTALNDLEESESINDEGHKVPFTLENVNKEDELRRAENEHRSRKSKVLSAEYKYVNRYINYSDTKITRSASTAPNEFDNDIAGDEGNISSEALAIQRTYFLDAGAISAICFTVFGVCCTVGTLGIVLYRRRYLNKPQALSEPDSSVYIDDSTIRVSDNSDEMYSLDNDSFLNSLEAMTIQNYWTDTVKHTKL